MSRNSTSTNILLGLILLITFPVWIGIGGAIFGIVIGLFGAVIGIAGGIFGIFIALVMLPFRILFGIGHWGWNWGDWHGSHHHNHWFLILTIIIIAVLLVRKKRNA